MVDYALTLPICVHMSIMPSPAGMTDMLSFKGIIFCEISASKAGKHTLIVPFPQLFSDKWLCGLFRS